jgi:biopolymer transport protein TolR
MGMNTNEKAEVMAEINMTPFIDIVLVLLIIFIASVTAMVGGINVELPSSKSAKEQTKQNEQILIVIQKNGKIMVNETEIASKQAFEKAISKAKSDTPLAIKAEKSVEYNKVVEVLDLLGKQNLTNVTLLTNLE